MRNSRLIHLILLSLLVVPALPAQDGGGGDPIAGLDCFGERLLPSVQSPTSEYLFNAEPFDAICLPEAWAFMASKWQAGQIGIPNWPFAVVIDDGFFPFDDSKIRPSFFPGYPDGSLAYPYGTALGGNYSGRDYGAHGTAVLSVLAARGNNGEGLVGVAAPWENISGGSHFGPTYLPVRIGRGDGFGDEIENLARAFDEVVFAFHEVRVVNLSQNLPAIDAGKAAELEPRLDEANWRQVAVVIAAGNDQRTLDSGHWLRQHPNVILVGALNRRGDDLWNNGPNGTATGDGVDIYAPGQNIEIIKAPSKTEWGTGTSFAAPMVTGVVTMIQNLDATLNAAAVRAILVESADPIQTSTGKIVPRLNARKAVACASTFQRNSYAPGYYQFWCDLGPQGPISGTYSIF